MIFQTNKGVSLDLPDEILWAQPIEKSTKIWHGALEWIDNSQSISSFNCSFHKSINQINYNNSSASLHFTLTQHLNQKLSIKLIHKQYVDLLLNLTEIDETLKFKSDETLQKALSIGVSIYTFKYN